MNRLTESEKEKILNFAKGGKSLNKISFETSIPKTTLYYHLKNHIRKNSQLELKKASEIEIGYILGLFFGDGHFDIRKNNYSYRIVFSFDLRRDKKIVKKLIQIFKTMKGKPYIVTFSSRNTVRVICISKKLFLFLKNFLVYKKLQRGKAIINKKFYLKNIDNWNKDRIRGFIAGIIDSDGHIGRTKYNSEFITIATFSKKFAQQIIYFLEIFGFLNSVSLDSQNIYRIRISTKSFERILQLIPIMKRASRSMVRSLPSQGRG